MAISGGQTMARAEKSINNLDARMRPSAQSGRTHTRLKAKP